MEENDVQEVQANPAEVKARQFGWVPQEEFKGNADDWKDADTFLKRGEEINGFLRKDMEKLNTKLSQRDAELLEIRQTMEEFRKYHNETEARAYKRAVDDLKKQKVEAIESGDGVRVVEIDEQIDNLKDAQKQTSTPAVKQDTQAHYNTEFNAWAVENTWFVTNPEAKALAEIYGQELASQEPELKGRKFLDKVTKTVKEAHPDLFENPARKNAAVASSSDGRSPSIRTKKSYNDLPADAKAACDKFVKQKLMTQDQYLAEYEWDK